jgi:hypothetical protein
MSEVYEVVSPLGDAKDAAASQKKSVGAPALNSLSGKKIGLIWTAFANGDTALRAFREHLSKRFADLELFEMMPGRGLAWGDHPHQSIADLAREHGIDGAIVAAGC